MTSLPIGRLLRASTSGFVAGCAVSQFEQPALGALVAAPLGADYRIYGLIHDIHIDDDGLVRQLVTTDNVSDEVMRDNRERRIVPVEMSVLAVGYVEGGKVFHLLPPRPPLSLDVIHLCGDAEVAQFTGTGRFGYLRHVLRLKDAPLGDLLAAHIKLTAQAHGKNAAQWKEAVTQELIVLLRDDYATLMDVLSALSDVMEG